MKIFQLLISFLLIIPAKGQSVLKDKIDSLAELGIRNGIPGIQILVAHKGDTYNYQYGFQDVDQIRPVNDSTNWRYGSITKLFTTVVILQLEAEGKLSTSDLVTDYLDLTSRYMDSITIHHLLNHTSGLFNYTADSRLSYKKLRKNDTRAFTMIQCMEYGINRKPQFKPGEDFQYCNTGFVVLGSIIEKLTGKSIAENFEERIFSPCNLKSMQYSIDEKVPSNTARGYIKKRKKYIDYTELNHGWANTAGAILGSADDLCKFNECLFDGVLLDSVQLKKMITPTHIFRDLKATGREWYDHATGLGFFLNLDASGKVRAASHGGNTYGYNCFLIHSLQEDWTLVICMNLFPNGEYEPVFSIQNKIVDIIYHYYKGQKEK